MNSEVFQLPKPGHDVVSNLASLVEHFKEIDVFPEANWEDYVWPVRGRVKPAAAKANKDHFLYFTCDNGLGLKVKTSTSEMQAFHCPVLTDIAKCHVCFSNNQKTKAAGSLQAIIIAYRFLDDLLYSRKRNAYSLKVSDFEKAIENAFDRCKEYTAYRVDVQLKAISKFIYENKLAEQRRKYKGSLKRSDVQTASDNKISKEKIDDRNKKLPDRQVLQALGQLHHLPLNQQDRIFLAMTDLLFVSGLRFSELAGLSVDSLAWQEEHRYCEKTGTSMVDKYLELRWFGSKGGGYLPKVIDDVFVKIAEDAFSTLREHYQDVRELIGVLESEGSHDFYPELDGDLWVSEVFSHFGTSTGNACTYLKKRGVKVTKASRSGSVRQSAKISATDLKNVTNTLAKNSIKRLWDELRSVSTATKLSDILIIDQYQANHDIKRSEPWEFRTLSHTPYSDFLCGRKDGSIKSIFERHNLKVDGVDFRITSHQFRHFLNTLLQLTDSVTELEIARYFGRSYVGDNEAYDHTNSTARVFDSAQDIIDSNNLNREQAIDTMNQFVIVDRDEAIETIEHLATNMKTKIGMCNHDFADSPCGKHYACLRGCSEYKRTKGVESEIISVKEIKSDAEVRVAAAKEAVDEQFWGSNNWLLSHEQLLEGCEKALAIELDESVAPGETVTVFPEGNNGCEPL